MEELKIEPTQEDECKNHCYYRVGLTGKIILCRRCARVKAIKEADGEWKALH